MTFYEWAAKVYPNEDFTDACYYEPKFTMLNIMDAYAAGDRNRAEYENHRQPPSAKDQLQEGVGFGAFAASAVQAGKADIMMEVFRGACGELESSPQQQVKLSRKPRHTVQSKLVEIKIARGL